MDTSSNRHPCKSGNPEINELDPLIGGMTKFDTFSIFWIGIRKSPTGMNNSVPREGHRVAIYVVDTPQAARNVFEEIHIERRKKWR
jgi:hypothetical protein